MRAMPSGQQVVNFGIATNRFYTDQQGQKKQDTEFHNIVAFGKLADIISRYVTKGTLLLVEGRIKTSSWDDKNGGGKKSRTEIIAETMQLGPRPGGMGGGGGQSNFQKPASRPAPTPKSEEIPIIEENYLPAQAGTPLATDNTVSFPDNNPEEIDVKDIPF